MRRRAFICFLGTAAAWPLASRAARPEPTRRVGVLLLFSENDPEATVRVRAFGQALQDLGWKEGDNVRTEYRFGEGNFERMRQFAKELIAQPVDAMVTNSLQAILAVAQEDHSVPVVFAMVPDPVGSGLVKSLSHPGENLTGFTTFEPSIIGKWVELLKGVAPGVRRVGFVHNPNAYEKQVSPPRAMWWSQWLRELEAVAPSFSLETIALPVHDLTETRRAFAALSEEPGGSLLINVDPFTVGHHGALVALALQHRLPACYPYNYFAAEGGLMSYGPNGAGMFRQAATYVDRILRGASPGDLPIQQANAFELVINLRTADAMGLAVPPWMIARADGVIE
jgi:putative tryptophan/tyrosine transport system substrate-binding protein